MSQKHNIQALSVEYKVDFANGKGRAVKKKSPKTKKQSNKLPCITRLLALAHHLQDLLDQGVVKDYADIARLSGLSRARVTQIMNLTLLAPKIQEDILFAPIGNKSSLNQTEHAVRMVLKTPVWDKQIEIWNNPG